MYRYRSSLLGIALLVGMGFAACKADTEKSADVVEPTESEPIVVDTEKILVSAVDSSQEDASVRLAGESGAIMTDGDLSASLEILRDGVLIETSVSDMSSMINEDGSFAVILQKVRLNDELFIHLFPEDGNEVVLYALLASTDLHPILQSGEDAAITALTIDTSKIVLTAVSTDGKASFRGETAAILGTEDFDAELIVTRGSDENKMAIAEENEALYFHSDGSLSITANNVKIGDQLTLRLVTSMSQKQIDMSSAVAETEQDIHITETTLP